MRSTRLRMGLCFRRSKAGSKTTIPQLDSQEFSASEFLWIQLPENLSWPLAITRPLTRQGDQTERGNCAQPSLTTYQLIIGIKLGTANGNPIATKRKMGIVVTPHQGNGQRCPACQSRMRKKHFSPGQWCRGDERRPIYHKTTPGIECLHLDCQCDAMPSSVLRRCFSQAGICLGAA